MLYFYLLTCEHSNILKCFVCRKLYMAADLGWSLERVTKTLKEVQAAKLREDGDLGLIVWDDESEIVLITNGLIKDKIRGEKQIGAAAKVVNSLPFCPQIFGLLLGILEDSGEFSEAFDDLRQALHDRVSDTLYHRVSIPPGTGIGTGKGIGSGKGKDEEPLKRVDAKQRREALFAEVQRAYPTDNDRHLSGETTGRNAYVADLKHFEKNEFASEAEMHAFVLSQVRLAGASDRWLAEGGRYIPGIGTFFKNRLWRGTFKARDNPKDVLGKSGAGTAENMKRVLDRMAERQADGRARQGQ